MINFSSNIDQMMVITENHFKTTDKSASLLAAMFERIFCVRMHVKYGKYSRLRRWLTNKAMLSVSDKKFREHAVIQKHSVGFLPKT